MQGVVDFKVRHVVNGGAVVQLRLESSGWVTPFPVMGPSLAPLLLTLQTGRASYDASRKEIFVRPISSTGAVLEDLDLPA